MLDDEWTPAYGPEGFLPVAVHCGEQPSFGEFLSLYADIALPLVWDLEWEMFYAYRIPGIVFPLRVLVGRDGNIAFLGSGEEYDGDTEDERSRCPGKVCPCEGREDLCLTRDAVEQALGL